MSKKYSLLFYFAAFGVALLITFYIFMEVDQRNRYRYAHGDKATTEVFSPPPPVAAPPLEYEKVPDSVVRQLLPNIKYLLSYCDTIQKSGILDKEQLSEDEKKWLLTQEIRFNDSVKVILSYPIGSFLSENLRISIADMHSMFKLHDYEDFARKFQERREILEDAFLDFTHVDEK